MYLKGTICLIRDQARGQLGQNSRAWGRNFALNWDPGRYGSLPKKKI